MPAKGEKPITSYFPRITSRQTPAKRTRQVDEADSARKNSIKKPKNRQEKDGVGAVHQPSPSTSSRTTPSSSRRSVKKASKTVIDIWETQPNTPTKSVSIRVTTPLSSPLPLLTPSPSPPRSRTPTYHPYAGDTVNGNGPGSPSSLPIGANYSGPQEVELPELIPSSQTQNLDLPYVEEDPWPNISSRKHEHYGSSQSSNYIPSSQPDTTHLDLQNDPDHFVASSQSQFMELTPTSPIDHDSELVPSSQTQELGYSQGVDSNSLHKTTVPLSGPRPSLFDKCIDESQSPPQSSVRQYSPENEATLTEPPESQTEADQEEGPRDCTPTIPSSQTPPDLPSSSSQGGEPLPSSPPAENAWNDERSSYESLPDAIKDLQDMFSGSYESYPPDFPMSLR